MNKKTIITGIIAGTLALGGTAYFGGDKDEVSKVKFTEKYNTSVEVKAKYQIVGSALVKNDIKNAELDKYKGEPKDEIKITLGDNATEFTPSIELKRWNEVSFKIKPKDLDKVATKDKTLSFEGEKIKYGTPKMSFEMYEYAEGEGGYKYIWYLNEKPASRIVSFDIETEGLDFFYQPPLNEENTDPNLTCTETQCKNKDGNVMMERPENVVDSYAVHHSTKGGMVDSYGKDYKTGKAFHIYRPHLIDANGLEAWGNLHIENRIYSVEIPQDFLDKAVYPIKSNDTFGYTTDGASIDSINDRYRGNIAAMPSNGTITSFSMSYMTISANESIKVAIYSYEDPATLVAYSVEDDTDYGSTLSAANAIFRTLALHGSSGASLSNGVTYRITGNQETSAGACISYDGLGVDSAYSVGGVSPSTDPPPSPLTPWLDGSVKRTYSIYATYTADAPPAGAAPIQDIFWFD